MKLNDAHIHLFQGGFPGGYGTLFPQGRELRMYESIRQVHSIDRALVVGYEGEAWARGNNKYLARLAKDHRWIAPLAYLHVTRPPSIVKLRGLWATGFYGVSLYVNTASDVEALSHWPNRIWEELNAHRAVLSLNCPATLIAGLHSIFFALPEARILVSHLGMPSGDLEAPKLLKPIFKLADFPNAGVKLSGAYAIDSFPHPKISVLVRGLFESFGSKRLYWGSDFSPALDQVTFGQTITPFTKLSPGESSDVFGSNLARLIGRVRLLPAIAGSDPG